MNKENGTEMRRHTIISSSFSSLFPASPYVGISPRARQNSDVEFMMTAAPESKTTPDDDEDAAAGGRSSIFSSPPSFSVGRKFFSTLTLRALLRASSSSIPALSSSNMTFVRSSSSGPSALPTSQGPQFIICSFYGASLSGNQPMRIYIEPPNLNRAPIIYIAPYYLCSAPITYLAPL